MPIPRIAIVGAPNAGKSTLFNRLLGRRKALVHAEPGMTRDLNEAVADLEGRRVTLVDTGGLFAPGDSILAGEVRRRVVAAAGCSDLLVFLVDGRRGLTPLDAELSRLFRGTGRPVVLAVNTLDVPGREEPAAEFHRLGFTSLVSLSAEHGLGIGELVDAILERLPGEADATDEEDEATGEIRLAIAGRPNVGKSSLLNALLGDDKAIVSEIPGTTRDAVDSVLEKGGRRYRIVDTAGLRRRGRIERGAEALSAMSARRSIERADVALVLMDATEAPTLQDLHVAGVARDAGRPLMVLLNKWDILESRRRDEGAIADPEELIARVRGRLRFAPHAPILTISALSGLRVGRILPTVDRIHAQATRKIPTGRLNNWLRRAVAAHRPPSVRGREVKLYYMAQRGLNPPAFVVFANMADPPHFSYRRYLENGLREAFELTLTPVIVEYRERPRRSAPPKGFSKKPGKRPV